MNGQTDQPTPQKPLRLWPGVVIAALQLLGIFVVPVVAPKAALIGMLVGAAGVLGVLVWWVFFSRARWMERAGILVLMVVALLATRPVLHPSVAGAGMGMLFFVYGLMSMSVALVAGLVIGRGFSVGARRALTAACVLLACVVWSLVRTGGMTGDADSDLAWRWSQTPEERLLAQAGEDSSIPAPATAAAAGAEVVWPGFRGPGRDGVVAGSTRISADWSQSPPAEMWRRPVGPGWSSFAVGGDLFYTQEQRGEHEVVSCYRLSTGQPVWTHRDAVRFYESNAGAGPRGTPTLIDGRIYTLGATGILNVLKADDGSVVWSRNVATDTQVKVPTWGFSSSPLVLDELVIVAAGGTLAAYDRRSGEPRWTGPKSACCYSSPHRVNIGGVPQIVLMNGPGALGIAPEDGRVLWQHTLPTGGRIIQPALTAEGDLLLAQGEGSDLYRVAVAQKEGGWAVEERWTSEGLKPYFSDFVVHKGHAYGFDAGSIACIDLRDGARRWAGGDYGSGQLVLLPEQDALLVVSESGELAIVGATHERFAELARRPAIKGKTWNHPVLAGDVLLVRNAEEMAAFRLPVQSR